MAILTIFCCIAIQSSHFITLSHSESVSARTSHCLASWTQLLSGMLSSSVRRAWCYATARPHWGRCCWWSQGQSTRQTEGTHALLRVHTFETRFSLGMKPTFLHKSILQSSLISGAFYCIRRQYNFNNQQRIPQMGEVTCRAYRVLLQQAISTLTPNPTQTKGEPVL